MQLIIWIAVLGIALLLYLEIRHHYFVLPRMQKEVLAILSEKEWMLGTNIRKKLAEKGIKVSGPRFYFEMAKFRDQGLIQKQVEDSELEGYMIYETYFALAKVDLPK